MELEEFVQNSLVQIMNGILSAQKEWDSKCSGYGVISPAWDGPDDFRNRTQEVKFDVAVTAATKTEGGGGGGIKVWPLTFLGRLATLLKTLWLVISHFRFQYCLRQR